MPLIAAIVAGGTTLRHISAMNRFARLVMRIDNLNVSSCNRLLASFPAGVAGSIHKHTDKEFLQRTRRKEKM